MQLCIYVLVAGKQLEIFFSIELPLDLHKR